MVEVHDDISVYRDNAMNLFAINCAWRGISQSPHLHTPTTSFTVSQSNVGNVRRHDDECNLPAIILHHAVLATRYEGRKRQREKTTMAQVVAARANSTLSPQNMLGEDENTHGLAEANRLSLPGHE